MNTVLKSFLKPLLVKIPFPIRYIRNIERKDPGIRKRAAILQQNLNAEDDLDDLEADFFDLSKSHKQHEREVDASRELQKYHIVRQKYFKEKLPNFLTWADKQQIKHLHSSNAEEWTVERLSEGFPALPDIIQKIVKNDWVPKNSNRVRKHDEAVQQNWQLFKTQKNDLKLPPDVIAHLDKFTSRDLNLNPDISKLNVQDCHVRELVKKGGEFSNIIQSYEAFKTKSVDKKRAEQPDLTVSQSNDALIVQKKESTKMLTYDELQQKVLRETPKTPSETNEIIKTEKGRVDQGLIDDVTSTTEIVLHPEELNLNVAKFKTSEKQVNLYKPKRDYSNLRYPERINIPEDKRKRGHTYKLNDCFYDSDGEFLYRVPGLY